MTFEETLKELKAGKKVKRKSLDWKGYHLVLFTEDVEAIFLIYENEWLDTKYVANDLDLLAEDWEIVQ